MSENSRRKLLKTIAGASGAVVAGKSLPSQWTKPVVDSVMLPAHARTSQALQYTNIQLMNVQSEDRSTVASVIETLLPTAKAQGPQQWSCLTTEPGWATASIDGLITNANGSAQVSAENIPVSGAPVELIISQCDPSSLIGQATVQITSVDANKAVGQYSIGGGGSNIVPFELPIGNCMAPMCTDER